MRVQRAMKVGDEMKRAELVSLLAGYRDRRVCVVGTTCSGKSTLMAKIPDARDMDAEIFPLLSEEESRFVCQEPWKPEIGQAMNRFVRERVKAVTGRPVFGTVVIDCDVIVILKISDELLRERCARRGVSFEDARNMGEQLARWYLRFPILWRIFGAQTFVAATPRR